MAAPPSMLAYRIPRPGAYWTTVHRLTESDMTEVTRTVVKNPPAVQETWV